MSGNRQLDPLGNPDQLTRQPAPASAGGGDDDALTPEQAAEEAKAYTAKLERDRDAAQARAQSAERERNEARARERDSATEVASAQERAVLSGIEQQKSLVASAKQAIVTAQSAGDAVSVADAYEQLAQATARITGLEQQKSWIDSQKGHRQQTQQPVDRQSQPDPDAVEVTTPGGTLRTTPAVKAWTDDHPRFKSDAGYYNHAVAAHSTIVNDGVREGTPAYFRALTDAMTRYERFESYERGDGGQQVNGQQQQQRRGSPASSMGAPVSRSGASVPRGGGAPSPEAIARRIGPGVTVDDLREFARHNGYRGEEGFQAYLIEQQKIADIERAGGDTGMRVDQVLR